MEELARFDLTGVKEHAFWLVEEDSEEHQTWLKEIEEELRTVFGKPKPKKEVEK